MEEKRGGLPAFLVSFTAIGFALCSYKLGNLIFRMYPLFIPKQKLIEIHGKSWALITGATDGIGKEFVNSLSAEGFNILLTGRNEKKMSALISEFEEKYPLIEYKPIIYDFKNSFTDTNFKLLFKSEIENLPISILVNNVGSARVNYLMNMENEQIEEELSINVYTNVFQTKFFLENARYQKHENIKKYAIINVGSAISQYPQPFNALYSASKGFSYNLSQSLMNESIDHKKESIHIFHLSPFFVQTKLISNFSDFWTVSPSSCVQSALQQFSQGKLNSFGHWKHELIDWIPMGGQMILGVKSEEWKKISERMEKVSRRKKRNES